jgi:hypothetical protein
MSRFRLVFEAWVVISLGLMALLCLIWYLRSLWRDHVLRGERISAAELNRERITVLIPLSIRDLQ